MPIYCWGYSENDIGRIGNSFSIQDIALAVGNDLAEIRAVTGKSNRAAPVRPTQIDPPFSFSQTLTIISYKSLI